MDLVGNIGIVVVAALLAVANGSQVSTWLMKWWPARPDDSDPDDEHEHDGAEYHRHLTALSEIADCCEYDNDQKGRSLATDLAVHLTERRFGGGEIIP